MARRVHKATDGLPAEAVQVMVAGFRAHKTYAAVGRDLAALGIKVSQRAVERRGQEWEQEQRRRTEAREHARALVAAMRDENLDAAEILGALATDALLMEPDRFVEADAVKVQRLNLKRMEEQRKERELAVRERDVAVNERRVALLEQRATATEEVLRAAPAGAELTAEQQQKIREIYGLN